MGALDRRFESCRPDWVFSDCQTIDEIPLPPNVQRVLTMRSGGASWKDEAAAADMEYRMLLRYVRSHPDSLQFLAEQTKDALDQSHSILMNAAPAVANRLLEISLDV